MSPYAHATHDIPHSPPLDGRFSHSGDEKVAVIQARLNGIARRDPAAVLSVLESWLGPNYAGNRDASDR